MINLSEGFSPTTDSSEFEPGDVVVHIRYSYRGVVVDFDKKDNSINPGTGFVRKVAVELGVASDDRIQVIGEIKAGDFVVVEGNERLVPNSQVKIVVGKKSEK